MTVRLSYLQAKPCSYPAVIHRRGAVGTSFLPLPLFLLRFLLLLSVKEAVTLNIGSAPNIAPFWYIFIFSAKRSLICLQTACFICRTRDEQLQVHN